ncbi:hypothetical protein TRFO_40241 [Tritrichomonas foetus]|uniref:F5/8 type C domain-containing protein n=1 Tax=Tritrichomonas foetus TaxID=1144522 RepID=A0A1J4J7U5_9EUKA|nr:hypothetical protein TRFO_40241 [Tritrichomonas foetus]|eukprot:OHS93485.1 hypothetical protein TRFO_40241 [Tritrichomonas foetus]
MSESQTEHTDKDIHFCLSRSLPIINVDSYSKDFTFYVNGKDYQTTKFIADILSPRIERLRRIDPTFCDYSFTTHHKGNFNRVLQLAVEDEDFVIKEKERPFFIEVLEEFKNLDVLNILPEFEGDLSIENVVSRLVIQTRIFSEDTLTIVNKELDYIAKNFFLIPQNELLSLPIEQIHVIFANPELCTENEDLLINFIFQLIENAYKTLDLTQEIPQGEDSPLKEIYALLEFIDFNKLTKESMEKFVKIFEYGNFTNGIWQSICNCLLSHYETTPNNPVRYPTKIEFSEGKEKNGIITYLCGKYGDVIQNGLIKAVSSSIFDEKSFPQNATKITDDSKFATLGNDPDQWMYYKFIDFTIIPTHYSIRAESNLEANINQPINWVIESSTNGESWVVIDKHENEAGMNAKNALIVFPIEKPLRSNYIRIRQTGANSGGKNYLAFSALELFGTIIGK